MANYSLTGIELTDADGIALLQTSEPLRLAIGERKKLSYTFARTPFSTPTYEYLWISPALFITQGDIYQPLNTVPIARYFSDIAASLAASPTAEIPMAFNGDVTQSNEKVTYEIVSTAEIKIHVYFYVTADIQGFLGSNPLDNGLRLSQKTFNATPGAYGDPNSTIGLYMVSEDDISGINYYNIPLLSSLKFWNGDEGIGSQSFQIFRSATPQTDLSALENNDIEFELDAGIVFDFAKIWIVDLNSIQSNTQFWDDAAIRDNATVSFVSGTNYKASYTLPSTSVNQNGDYIILAVFYSTASNKTITIQGTAISTEVQDSPAYPDVQSKIEDYLKEYGDYVKAPVYDRLKFSLFLDKGTYNARSIIGTFDDNFKGWKLDVIQSGITVQTFLSDTATDIFTQTDSPTNFDITYNFRIEKAWGGSLISFQWTFFFDNGLQSDTIGFLQLVEAHEDPKNLAGTLLYDNSGFFTAANILDNFCSDLNQVATVRTGSVIDNMAQLAVLVLPEIQEEESYNTAILLPQLSGDNLQEVEAEWTAGFAISKIDLEGITPDAIAILGKEITENFDFGSIVNLTYNDQ